MSGRRRRTCYDTSTDPSRGRIRREITSALGMLVVVFNLVAGSLVAASTPAGAAPFLDEVFGDGFVVCTGAGMVVLDAAGHPIDKSGGVARLCAFCLPLMQGGADAPPVAAAVDRALDLEPDVRIAETRLAPAAAPAIAAASPRGPPRA